MSKQKTLFNFFSRSPALKSPSENGVKNNKKDDSIPSTPKSTPRNKSKQLVKRKTLDSDADSHSDAEESKERRNKTPAAKSKRKRIVVASESDDSGDEYRPGKDEISEEDDEVVSPEASEEEDSPKPKKKKLNTSIISPSISRFKNSKISGSKLDDSELSSPKNSKEAKKKNSSLIGTPASEKKSTVNGTSNGVSEDSSIIEEVSKEWLHDNLDWLKEDKLKDKYGRRKSDPEYNSRTVYVPEHFKKNLTPAMKQWWDMKADHFDTVLFFKVGKFYELYHMDAVVGVKELGLTYMKGEFAHSGFPEIAYGRFSQCLVEKGYKVARVEQTETPQMMEERVKSMLRPTKFDKVVSREICQITTRGTRMLNYQDEPMGANNNYLLAICEKHDLGSDSGSEYGICFVDTSIGKFTLGQFEDDRYSSRLMTMIALYPPVEILYERSSLSKKTLQFLHSTLNNVPKEGLNSGSQFWDSSKVLKFLSEEGYFKAENDSIQWPEAVQQMLDPDDRLHQTPLKQYELGLKSLGACIWYLKECRIEDNLLSMKLFEEYKPVDGIQITLSPQRTFGKQHMILDGITLRNLEIVPLRSSDDTEGTLLGTIDHCSTNFGKRLLRHWLCSPLCNPEKISSRLDAVEDLIEIPEVVEAASFRLKKVPDLERLLSKIHSQGLSRSKDHPESRAVFYEADIYNKRKLLDFLSTLDGFKESIAIVLEFKSCIDDLKSSLLKQCVTSVTSGGRFPDMKEALEYFDNAFDHEVAKKEGNIIPNHGVDSEYDTASSELKEVENELEDYLNEMKSMLNCRVSYVGSGRTRFQLEVPDHKKVPESFEFQGARKGFRRYYTSEGKSFVSRMIAAEESRDAALRDVARRIFAHFDANYDLWKSAVHCLSVIDVLISFCIYCKSSEVDMCRPEIVLPTEDSGPFLEIIDGRHPTFLKYFTGDTYIPNNIYLGPKRVDRTEDINSGGKLVLVTGPNMGGKSTIMRQAGILVIMSQMGCFVPATSIKLTPVDRIFTRVGANDQISKGESTFFVEASETSCILHHATTDSFVLIDELGRGTSTHDGTAIASSVLNYLANEIRCRTLFSTHYHSLVEDFHTHPFVGLGHMACMVEKDITCPELERITFLYKFIDGSCPKSYGFNVALLAGIAKEIVQKGFVKAQELENYSKVSIDLRKLLSSLTPEELTQRLDEKLRL